MGLPNKASKGEREVFRIPALQILLIILPLVILTFFVPTGIYVERPGDAVQVDNRIQIQGAQTYENPGALMLTTVSLIPSSLLELSVALFGNSKLESEVSLLGPNPDPNRNNQIEVEAMNQSKQAAAAAALIHLGYNVSVTQEGVQVDAVAQGLPADGKLQVGDVITAVNGQPALTTAVLKNLIVGAGIGTELTLRVSRGGQYLDIALTSVENPNQPGEPVIGIADEDKVKIDLPFPVQIDTGGIGGPSAGTMMALSIIDVLTPGGMTGGKKIAGTGTIDVQGNVGAIGGINFKIKAAESAGAVAFIYPVDNESEVDKVKARIPLYPVKTLDEALQAVHAISSGT